jgi:hypothetical protein
MAYLAKHWAQLMEILQEVTDWDCPNHVYWIEGDKCVAFQPLGQSTVIKFKSGMRFDRAHRKFTKLKHTPKDNPNLIRVLGSKGSEYWVDVVENSCSCTGFRFRGHCKHLCQASEASQ